MANQKTILILHGWGSSKKQWERVSRPLQEAGFNVLVPDMPGFGENPPPPQPWTGDDYLNWILNFAKSYKLEANKLFVAGHSFGGGLAMKLAIKHPELVEKLVLIAAARIKRKKSLYKKFVGVLAKIGKPLAKIPLLRKIFYKFIVREKDYIRTEGVMRETFKNVIGENITPHIGKIKAKTLIIWGDKDRLTPIEDAYLLKSKIKESELKILEGYDHDVNIKCPEKLAESIINFIEN